jgi:hypothetical protein
VFALVTMQDRVAGFPALDKSGAPSLACRYMPRGRWGNIAWGCMLITVMIMIIKISSSTNNNHNTNNNNNNDNYTFLVQRLGVHLDHLTIDIAGGYMALAYPRQNCLAVSRATKRGSSYDCPD